jgi:hypothetical protein
VAQAQEHRSALSTASFLDEHDLAFQRVLTDFALNIAVRLNVSEYELYFEGGF